MNNEIIQALVTLVALHLQARSYSVLKLVISGLLGMRISGSSGVAIIHDYFAEWACPASQPLVIPKVQRFHGSLLVSSQGRSHWSKICGLN